MTENLIAAKNAAIYWAGDAWESMTVRERLYAIQDELALIHNRERQIREAARRAERDAL